MNFYHRFLPRCANLMQPLHILVRPESDTYLDRCSSYLLSRSYTLYIAYCSTSDVLISMYLPEAWQSITQPRPRDWLGFSVLPVSSRPGRFLHHGLLLTALRSRGAAPPTLKLTDCRLSQKVTYSPPGVFFLLPGSRWVGSFRWQTSLRQALFSSPG